jgi:hypothetical protein
MRVWQTLSALAPLALIGQAAVDAASAPNTPPVPLYDISGVALHQCSCAYACPCMFENGPDDCALAAVYHIDRGTYKGVDVSGLSFVSIDGALGAHRGKACCAGPKQTPKAPAGVVYLDAGAGPMQKKALLALLQARGEWPGAGRPVKSEPIQFSVLPHGYSVVVPGLFEGETRQVLSRKGAPITVDGVGFAEGTHWIVGRSVTNDLHDARLGLRWHMPGTNGSWTPIHWTASAPS